jgi:hypothetical protein
MRSKQAIASKQANKQANKLTSKAREATRVQHSTASKSYPNKQANLLGLHALPPSIASLTVLAVLHALPPSVSRFPALAR